MSNPLPHVVLTPSGVPLNLSATLVFNGTTSNFGRLGESGLDLKLDHYPNCATENPEEWPSATLKVSLTERVFYHVTMQPHRRLPALYPEVETYLRELLVDLTRDSQFSVLEVGMVPTHLHLLIEKAPWADLLIFIADFQTRSSACIFDRFPELMRDMGTSRFWTDGGFHYERHTAASVETVFNGTMLGFSTTVESGLDGPSATAKLAAEKSIDL